MAGYEDPCLSRVRVLTGEEGWGRMEGCEGQTAEFGNEKPVETFNQESDTIIGCSCGSSWE